MGSGGDLAELRGLLVVVTFLSITVLLVAMIPGEFVVGSTENRQVVVPDNYSSSDVMAIASSTNYTIGLHFEQSFSLGGHYFTIFDDARGSVPGNGIIMYTEWWEYWGIIHNQLYMQWYDQDNIERSHSPTSGPHFPYLDKMMNFQTIDDIGVNTTWTVQCIHVTIKAMFGYNTTAYDNCTHAYENNALGIWLGINFDQVNTQYNAWNLIQMILFFQMPDVHPMINMIIAIPIWITIAYLVFTLITKLIPFT
ncbi:MAG: hypothetical protein MUO31_04830 [Thermodesulfovibrionales bacterium]|nr:hypothetical protein [Thermodesulfovibrionales bacterium]